MLKLDIQRFGGRGASSSGRIKRDIINIMNNGQVFDFSAGPTMTLISRYENGGYADRYSRGDSPMRFFEREVVPELKDEFVVIDDGSTKVPRYSRFKKYGYEKVGEITERKRNVMDGMFVDEESNIPIQYADKWVLMRKKKK